MMNFFKSYARLMVVSLKVKVRSFINKAIGSRYSESWVNAISKNYNHRNSYMEFLVNFNLRNFQSASDIARNLDFNLLSLKEKLVIVKCYYSSKYGILADQILEYLSNEILREGQHDTKLIVTLLDRVSISGFELDKKIKIFEQAKVFFDRTDSAHVSHFYALQWMYYSLQSQISNGVDPKEFISEKDVELYGVEIIAKFIPALNSFGYETYVTAVLESFLNRESHSYLSLKILTAYCKDRLHELEPGSINVQLSRENIHFLPVLYAGRDFNKEISRKYDLLFEFAKIEFHQLEISNQDLFLRFMLRNGMYEGIVGVSMLSPSANYFLPLFTARGYINIANDDFHTARACFEHVLVEDPADALAATGMRFALPRTGRPMGDLLNIRDRIGYGIKGHGRIGFRNFGSELTISLLMSGNYIKGQYSKNKSKHWIALKEHYGEKFRNFERLQSDTSKRIFVIGDEGVGDEIRTSQFYGELSKRYNDVFITCDPRLLDIFSASFPDIKFLPVPRIWKLVESHGSEPLKRLSGFGEKISNYLTEDCKSYMDTSDIVTFGQNVFFNYVLGDIARPSPGQYLRLPHFSSVLPERCKLRVGILWRSHLRVGARKMMYLDLEEFSPLLERDDIELWSIQHSMDEDEIEYCKENNIRMINDVDLFNDFEGLGNYLLGLDLLVGVSSVPMELGAALGIETWMLGFSPENYFLRTAGGIDSHDRYTLNSSVIAPPWIDFSNPRNVCIEQVFKEVSRRLEVKLRGHVDEVFANEPR